MDALTLAEKWHIKRMHDLLKRQLKRHFGGLDSIPKEWQAFVKTVNDAYWESDRNRIALEHALKSTTEDLTYADSELDAQHKRAELEIQNLQQYNRGLI